MPHDPKQIPADELIKIDRLLQSLAELQLLVDSSSREEFESDLKTRKAILHSLIEIGEGASRLKLSVRERLPEIPWAQIVHMRNILVHVYWGVDLSKIWNAATIHAPQLTVRLNSLVNLN